MAGAMRKMAVYLGLVEDDRYGEYGDDEYAADDRRGRYANPPTRTLQAVRDDEPRVTSRSEAEMTRSRGGYGADPDDARGGVDYRITTLHPRTYNDARAIGEAFRDNTPVIMNLTEMDDTDAKRIVDFAAGLVFGRHGTIERVTQKVFLLSPVNVVVTAEQRQRLAEGGFFNQS